MLNSAKTMADYFYNVSSSIVKDELNKGLNTVSSYIPVSVKNKFHDVNEYAHGKYEAAKSFAQENTKELRTNPKVNYKTALIFLGSALGSATAVSYRNEIAAATEVAFRAAEQHATSALTAAKPYAYVAMNKGAEMSTKLANYATNAASHYVTPVIQHFTSLYNSGLNGALNRIGAEWKQYGLNEGALGIIGVAHSAYCLYNLYKNGGDINTNKALAYTVGAASFALSAMTALSPASPIHMLVVTQLNLIAYLMTKNIVVENKATELLGTIETLNTQTKLNESELKENVAMLDWVNDLNNSNNNKVSEAKSSSRKGKPLSSELQIVEDDLNSHLPRSNRGKLKCNATSAASAPSTPKANVTHTSGKNSPSYSEILQKVNNSPAAAYASAACSSRSR